MVFVAALFFCAGVGMWLCLLAVRAGKIAFGGNRRRHRQMILTALDRYRAGRDRARLIEELRNADPSALVEVAARVLPLLTGDERKAFETALARRRVAQFIARKMGRASEAKRILYCELLGILGSERSLGTLWGALRDRSPAVRISAAISLAARGEPFDLKEFLARLGTDARRSSRLTYFFDRLLAERAADVRSVARDARIQPRVRISAYVALIGLGEAAYLELVPEMASDPSPLLAATAARLLVERPHPAAAALIGRLLTSDSVRVRREATESAARLGDSRLQPALRRRLQDRDALVQAVAARSMVHLAHGTAPAGGPATARRPREPLYRAKQA